MKELPKINKTRIGIYPGAFDPIHAGHVAFAKQALEHFGLDKVYFLPEPRPRHKQGVKALEHRIAMIARAVKHEPQMGLVDVHDQQFTITETWPKITARFAGAELFMLLGSDVAMRLGAWPDLVEHIAAMPVFIVGMRQQSNEVNEVLHNLQSVRGIAIRYHLLETQHQRVSSADIRMRLRKGVVPSQLHPSVQRYITENNLYQPQSTVGDRD